MDLKLVNQELSEARLFRYSRSFGAFTGRQVADLMFLNLLSLQLLALEESTHEIARKYAQRSSTFSNFSLFRTASTDIYLLAYHILHPMNDHCNMKNPIEGKRFLKGLRFESNKLIMWLRQVGQGRGDSDWARQYFFRLETQLQIKDSRYKRWRRLIGSYNNLKFAQRNALIAQITFEIKRIGGGSGRGSELLQDLEPFKKKRGYSSAEKQAKRDAKKADSTSFTKRAVGTVAGAIAGKYATKKVAQTFNKDIDKYKKAGTGIGAIAGYWASGRKKQQ